MKPESSAIIILGASVWPGYEAMDCPAFARSAGSFAEYARGELAFSESRILYLFDDPQGPLEQLERIEEFLSACSSDRALEQVLIQYVGHGHYSPEARDYRLFVRSTSKAHSQASSMGWKDLVDSVCRKARGALVYAIVDACFSARASEVVPKNPLSVLCASSKAHFAQSDGLDGLTVFSASLMHVLRHGSRWADEEFTFRSLRDAVQRHIADTLDGEEREVPRPEVHSPRQSPVDPADLPLFRNPPVHQDLILPRDDVFGDGQLRGQEFAIELLNHPVTLGREDGVCHVNVTRGQSAQAIYSRDGKAAILEDAFPGADERRVAESLDRRAHLFLRGTSDESSLTFSQKNLRWASGGVISVVKWRGRTWIPFFFRDVPPYGWNISLGASEREDNLNDPWSFLVREFVEETLVLSGNPRPGVPVDHRQFDFGKADVRDELKHAETAVNKHIDRRACRDGLVIRPGGRKVGVATLPTNTELHVTDLGVEEARHRDTDTPDVLVGINLLELGIEVVKVVRYRLEDHDFLLDGEIYDPVDGDIELVRMPVGLMSVDWLRTVFTGTTEFAYSQVVFEGEESKPGTPPSVRMPAPPEDEIHIFDFDVRRRRDIAAGKDAHATDWEAAQYANWARRFGPNFLDADHEPSNGNACPWFTPASVKILSYFFANEVPV